MTDWKTDHEVLDAADKAARKAIDCFNNDHISTWLGPPEYYPNGGGAAVLHGYLQDATDVISLDPQKIIDEYERMQSVGRAISPTLSAEVINACKTIDYSLQDWQGEGAEAFQMHVSKIQAFMGQQADYVHQTLGSLAGLAAVAMQVRRDYCALAESTIAAAQKAMGEVQNAETKFGIGVGTNLATTVASTVLEAANPFVGAVGLIITTTGLLIPMSVDGHKSDEVMAGYIAARTKILENYKAELVAAKGYIDRARAGLAAEKNELFEPLPPTIDINSPNFGYRDFSSAAHDLTQFGDKVDEEHRKMSGPPGGFVNPDSPIQQRLEGQ